MNIVRVFTLINKEYQEDAEFAMIWRGIRTPTLKDFKQHWGDLLFEDWHKEDKIVEMVSKQNEGKHNNNDEYY